MRTYIDRVSDGLAVDIQNREAVIVALQAALQTVADPATYLHTGEHLLPSHRAALAERAKAMTGLMLFMMEGLMRARVRLRDKGICDVPSMVHASWLRYLQLHGRQAGVLVPMDGWLVRALPKRLLTKDEQVLGSLGSSLALGDARQATPDIQLTPELLLPAQLFGELTEQPGLALEIAALLSLEPPLGPQRKAAEARSIAHSEVADHLIRNFATALSGAPLDR